ncbi:hypothetical protein E2C01_058319 [Portunus trituberculatus]|uniref:Uncharacterized protein n=1 Tax=Portunus trituberculatus TaxID=210409 RepID=A0A5B7H512_PORTR|nr:hypothetical protein [Portunus trituberculatus]
MIQSTVRYISTTTTTVTITATTTTITTTTTANLSRSFTPFLYIQHGNLRAILSILFESPPV